MPIVGAKAILLSSDDGNNVRTAQRWARDNKVQSPDVPVAACALDRPVGAPARGCQGDSR